MENAARQGAHLMQALLELQKSHECMGDVRGKGLMVGVELVKDRETKERAREWRNQIIARAFAKGLLLLPCGDCTIRFCPALTVQEEEVDECMNIFEEAVREIAG